MGEEVKVCHQVLNIGITNCKTV